MAKTTTKATQKNQDASREWAVLAAQAAFEKKGLDIVVQEVRKQLVITDYFVIATGANNRQVDAICDAVEEALREKAGIKPVGREGKDELTWVLLDYGDFVVHVFQPDFREFYRLETIWNDAPRLDLTEHGIEQ
ncbi:MAG: ribosome silencing factor [Coriobacteriia bacterium]|nr:ribosome silencing factor [Coriobacteriia bacterium]